MKNNKNLFRIAVDFLLAIILGLFTVGCTPYFKAGIDGKYDHSHIYVDAPDKVLDDVIRSVYRIETSTTFKVENNVSTLKIVGMAVSLDEKHLLTAKHVTSIDSYPAQTPFGLLRLPIPPEVKITETTSIVFDDGSRIPVTVIYRDKEMDFAVLEAGKKIDPPSYPIGNSKEFRITNLVVLPANFQTGLSIRIGYITQLDFIQYGPNGEVAEKRESIFGISTVVSEGDSGSPILLLRDGKFELGGIVSFIVLPARGIGYGLKITHVIESFKSNREDQKWILPLLGGGTKKHE